MLQLHAAVASATGDVHTKGTFWREPHPLLKVASATMAYLKHGGMHPLLEDKKRKYVGRRNSPASTKEKGDTLAQKSRKSLPPQS
mmetsp:Transcript_2034/g.5159  ORF Transcript_2034/g.5159 Transcript_2034/m.5159 type:complete len:85 (-) Transcript_2034:743-997(-)